MLPAFVAEIEAKRQPWTKDERREAALDFVARLDRRIARRMAQFNLWTMVAIAVTVPLLCGGSCLGGWWWGRHSETLGVQHAVASRLPGCGRRRGGVHLLSLVATAAGSDQITTKIEGKRGNGTQPGITGTEGDTCT